MANLHLIATSPSATRLNELHAAMSSEDAVLFIEDGVYFARASEALATLPACKVYFLSEDAQVRGIEVKQTVDYAGFVELTTQYDRCVSWY